MKMLVWWCLVWGLSMTCSKLLMVQTLTRHGTRAPDKIVGKVICKPMFDPKRSLNNAFVQLFGVGATELTGVGVRQMRDVGAFLREKYHGFLSADYAAHSGEWEFVAKEGDRQQRSMMGIVLGVFPNDVVPIAVTNKATDSILGGPAAQCGSQTHDYVIKWHQTKGRALVQTNEYADLIDTLERVCNISLLSDPVNLASRGANPHAYIGDISDFFDSLQETRFEEGLPISNKMHNKLTKLAFKLEHGAHFDFPGGAAMQAGGFPDHLLTDFDLFTNNPKTKPKGVPKIKMHTCSRELFYGLAEIFEWTDKIQLSGLPIGRISHGTTFIWELHSDFTIHTFYYQLPNSKVFPLMPPISVQAFREKYLNAVQRCGTWDQLCVERKNNCTLPAWFLSNETIQTKGSTTSLIQARMNNPPANSVIKRQKQYDGGWAAYFGWVVVGGFVLLLIISVRRSYYDGYSYL